jgi:hypothetical protein
VCGPAAHRYAVPPHIGIRAADVGLSATKSRQGFGMARFGPAATAGQRYRGSDIGGSDRVPDYAGIGVHEPPGLAFPDPH